MNSTEEWLTRSGGLAGRLRGLRRRANYTGQSLAGGLGWAQPKVSKIETGKQMPTAEDVADWARACGADDDTTRELQDMLTEARVIRRQWRQQGVHLLDSDPGEVDASVAARMRRQEVLYDSSRRFEFVVTEAALRLVWCPAAEMLAQLDRLIGVTTGPPHVWFGIIPFGVELPTVAQNRFVLFDDQAIVEGYVDETTYHGDDAAGFAKAMDLLMAEAWTDEQARRLILRAMQDLRRTL